MTTSTLKSKLSTTKEAATDTVKAVSDLARDAATTVKDEATSLATEAASTARDATVQRIDSARETLADAGDRLASTLQDKAADIEGLGARTLLGAANGMSTASNALRSHSLDDLIATTRDFAKRNPGAFAAGAAVAGFALARFLRSSSRVEAVERRAFEQTERVYRDAARRTVDTMGQGDGARS